MKIKKCRAMVERTQRVMAIRTCSAYRTVSTEAALVLAGLMPLDIVARERQYLYKSSGLTDAKELQRRTREHSLTRWQRRWENSAKGLWTRTLIPNIQRWIGRKHGGLDYYTTQMLTGHGCFKTYTKRITKTETDTCMYCSHRDSPQHTLYNCARC